MIIGSALLALGLLVAIIDGVFEITYDGGLMGVGVAAVLVGLVLLAIHAFGWDESHQHWVPAEALIARQCATHGGVKSAAPRAIDRGATDGWMVICNDGGVFAVKDGQYEDN